MIGRGMVESRSKAQRLVMAGQVRVNGQVVLKPSVQFSDEVLVTIDQPPRFVSRGGEKLLAAMQAFKLDVTGWVCADVGASTGGFTDCLLQRGAARVYAIDVGFGILHWKLRNDGRVVCMERTNARYLAALPEPVRLVTIDASFISLKLLMPVAKEWFSSNGGEVIALIKPQFEAGRHEAQRGEGVIQDPAIHRQVLADNIAFARSIGFMLLGLIPSPIRGPKGNMEFLAWYAWKMDAAETDGDEAIAQALSSTP